MDDGQFCTVFYLDKDQQQQMEQVHQSETGSNRFEAKHFSVYEQDSKGYDLLASTMDSREDDRGAQTDVNLKVEGPFKVGDTFQF